MSELSKNDLTKIVKSKWKDLLTVGVIFAMVSFSIAAFIPPKYKARTSILISQENLSDLDAYREAKSVEFSGRIAKEVIASNDFMNDILDSDELVLSIRDRNRSDEDKIKDWRRNVIVNQVPNTGILNISVSTKSRNNSQKIASSIAGLMVGNIKSLVGSDSVKAKVINTTFVEDGPAFPNLWLSGFLGFIFGILLAIVLFFNNKDLSFVYMKEKSKGKKRRITGGSSNAEIVEKLDKIRENLKKQKSINLVSEDYRVAEKENEESAKKMNEVEEAFKNEEEFVRVIEDNSSVEDTSKKGAAPKNLPIFQDEDKEKEVANTTELKQEKREKSPNKGFISMEELNKEAKKMGLTDDEEKEEKKEASKYEASSDEVKERLNKLLRGEL